jgi:hypothetical protein
MTNQKGKKADSNVAESASSTIKISNEKGIIEVRNNQGVLISRMLRF